MADSDGSYEAVQTTSTAALPARKEVTATHTIYNSSLHPSFDTSEHSSLVLKSNDKCYPLMLKYIGANIVRELGSCAYSMDLMKNGESCNGSCDRYDYSAWQKEHYSPSQTQGLYSSIVLPDLGF